MPIACPQEQTTTVNSGAIRPVRFSQDMPDEFDDHDTAVDDYRGTTDPHLVARTVGELRELLALGLSESDHALAVAELGMEVDPPASYAPGGWLALVAARLAVPPAGNGA
ncbi:contact-dependent growth inhibition system immunity protein [Streptomyces sp. NPDC059578]|uniref:contact-dependent growth inhibition system immunity protein n=1 Tax=Streptomyces sp. NPDC059578 TaxID=3346874 RepID=UPI0036B47F4E